MEKQEKENLKKLISDAEVLERLQRNTDFRHWKESIVDKELDRYLKSILSTPDDQPAARIRAYNMCKNLFEQIFTIRKHQALEASKQLEADKEE